MTNENLPNNDRVQSVDSIDWLDESYVERVAKECNMNLMYDDDGDYYDANVEDVVKFAQEIAKAAIQSNAEHRHADHEDSK